MKSEKKRDILIKIELNKQIIKAEAEKLLGIPLKISASSDDAIV